MAKKSLIGLLLSLVSISALAQEAVPGEFLVKLKPQIKASAQSLSAMGSFRPSRAGKNFFLVRRSTSESIKESIAAIVNTGLVERAEPNYIYKTLATSDSDYSKLWGIENTGQKDCGGNSGVAGFDVNAVKAWDITKGSESVVVAIIDTGVNINHPDLKDNIYVNQAEANGVAGVDDDNNGFVDDVSGWDFVKNKANGVDENGHGTHCAGTIAGVGDNSSGVVGVSWRSKILPVRFLDADGSGTLESAVSAINYATKMGAQIQSNSWGGGGYSETLKEAIVKANDAGILFIAAAGNESNNNDANATYPATYDVPNILSVAAMDNKGTLASFSNYGKKTVHVAAPGVKVWSTFLNTYKCLSGTSMATPHVSGVAALLLAHEPSLTAIEAKSRLISTAKPYSQLLRKVASGGYVDAYAALTNSTPPPDENDPARWASVPLSVSTEHPYKNKATQEFEVSVPGAKEFALYFAKFDTEANFDKVEFFNSAGTKLGELSGNLGERYSDTFTGDYVKIKFTSDGSINRYGFDLTKAAYR